MHPANSPVCATLRRAFLCFLVVVFIGGASVWMTPARGQTPAPPPAATNPAPADTTFAPIILEGRTLFEIGDGDNLSAAERADRAKRRLESLIARKQIVRPFSAQDLVPQKNSTLITLGGEPIMTVFDSDAQQELMTREELALQWGGKMASAVADARAARANALQGAGILIRNSFRDLWVSTLQWLPRLAGALVLALIFWALARFNRWIARLISDRANFDSNLRQLVRALVFYGTWVVGSIAILSTLGLRGSSIATGLGVSGFVLGFAFKDILSHFFAGLMLLIGRTFHIGDQIVVKEFEGTVERIELRALYLRTYDNRMVIIPNGDVFTSIVTSNTASPVRRRDFLLGIGYDDNIENAKKVALETVKGVEGVAETPPPDVLVDELAASSVNLRVRFHANSQRADYLKVGSECMRRVKEAFTDAKISMPTDIQTIVIQNAEDFGRREPAETANGARRA